MSSIITVSQLNTYIHYKLENDLKLKSIVVKGEISNFKRHYKTGHCYFTLKDNETSIKAVMFVSSASKLKFEPIDGMKVLITGNLELFKRDGVIEIIASDILPIGAGSINMKINAVKEKLLKQGVFDSDKKKAITLIPKIIGVITSEGAAALQDILQIIERRYPICKIELFTAQVQGEDSVNSICNAIKIADNSGCDTLILARGGGSAEDLMAFNDEKVVLAVSGCKTPIITAVGHETDTTLVDYASDQRAPTPSAAAELATPNKSDIIKSLEIISERIKSAFNKQISEYEKDIYNLENRLKLYSPESAISRNTLMIENYQKNLQMLINKKISDNEHQLNKDAAKLNALSPFNVLSRGYSMIEKDGEVVSSVNKLYVGDKINIKLSDGNVSAEISDINKECN